MAEARPRLSRRRRTQRSLDTADRSAERARTLDEARSDAASCQACPLWKDATQTVFGEGSLESVIMFVGEQPGDSEDRSGRPFVGPAGHLLDRALAEVSIDRRKVYVTNAVKHFKFEPRGKRRLHKKPAEAEIAACHPWLERELEFIRPKLVIALGATAARSLLGLATPIERNRGRVMEFLPDTRILITVHPSMLLRVPDKFKADAYRRFVADLTAAARFVRGD